jgi:hypothetical protein
MANYKLSALKSEICGELADTYLIPNIHRKETSTRKPPIVGPTFLKKIFNVKACGTTPM